MKFVSRRSKDGKCLDCRRNLDRKGAYCTKCKNVRLQIARRKNDLSKRGATKRELREANEVAAEYVHPEKMFAAYARLWHIERY